MRTTLTLDDDVADAARELAQRTGKSLGAVVSELARRGLRPNLPPAQGGKLPAFPVATDADIIPGDRASRLLDEEGP